MVDTGIDLVEIDRIEKSLKNPRFLMRFFSERERELFTLKNNNPQTIAANFAAKEAFSKAIGTGISGFELHEVEVLREDNGKPYLSFTGKALDLVSARGLSFSISLTHTKNYASAVVLCYKE